MTSPVEVHAKLDLLAERLEIAVERLERMIPKPEDDNGTDDD